MTFGKHRALFIFVGQAIRIAVFAHAEQCSIVDKRSIEDARGAIGLEEQFLDCATIVVGKAQLNNAFLPKNTASGLQVHKFVLRTQVATLCIVRRSEIHTCSQRDTLPQIEAKPTHQVIFLAILRPCELWIHLDDVERLVIGIKPDRTRHILALETGITHVATQDKSAVDAIE